MNKSWIHSTIAIVLCTALVGFTPPKSPSGAANRTSDIAPEFVGSTWINTKDGKPVTLESRHGKPTLVAFWTFGCINCRHNLPAYERLLSKYRSKGVELIAIHTPETRGERSLAQVKKHVETLGIDYPVLVDNDSANWDRWKIDVWPTLYVIDGNGRARFYWKGELNWQGATGEAQVARMLDNLLAESNGKQ